MNNWHENSDRSWLISWLLFETVIAQFILLFYFLYFQLLILQYLSNRHHKKTLKLKADSHLKHKLLRLTFTRWQHYHGWWGEINAYVETKMREKNQQLLRYLSSIGFVLLYDYTQHYSVIELNRVKCLVSFSSSSCSFFSVLEEVI